MEKMQRELKKAQKENQKQQQELEAAGGMCIQTLTIFLIPPPL